ncbi:MAG: efflux RND transporter periplasmic adaptor subunit [Pseudomonadota bacterium]|nr:efflux RND transporter periplasmic adaptor subunit [Pseudomonadota bacterium]
MLNKSNKGLLACLSALVLCGYTATVLGNETASGYAVESKALSELITHPEYRFSAEIKPHTTSVISSELNAKLEKVSVRPGVSVNKGKVLAELDCADTKAQLNQVLADQQAVNANLELSQLQLTRLQNLEDKQLVSTSQLDETRTQQKALQANLQGLKVAESSAKRAVSRCQIIAPYDAVVTEINAGEGQWLGMGTPVFELYRTDKSEIEVAIPLELASQYQHQPALWSTNVSSQKEVKWLRQSAVLESRQRMAKVWFEAPSKQPIGLAGTLLFKEPANYLPVAVMVSRLGQQGVFINQAGKAEFKPFESAQDGRPALVPNHWDHTWQVIVKGQQRLQDGDDLK